MRQISGMSDRVPQIEMTIDGEFVTPPKPPFMTRVLGWALLVAVLAATVVMAAFALWVAVIFLPIAIGAALVAYLAWRYQLWRATR